MESITKIQDTLASIWLPTLKGMAFTYKTSDELFTLYLNKEDEKYEVNIFQTEESGWTAKMEQIFMSQPYLLLEVNFINNAFNLMKVLDFGKQLYF